MKKFVTLILAIALVTVCLTGLAACGEKDTDIKAEYDGKLIVATNAAFPPFEMTDVDGSYIGIDMELAYEIGKILNYEVVINDMEFDSVLASVEAKTATIAMAGLTVNAKRLLTVDFCNAYFNASQIVIAKTGSAGATATTAEDLNNALKGKKIGFQNGTVGEFYVKGDADWGFDGIPGAVPSGFTNGAAAMLALTNGQIDYIVIDKLPAIEFVKKFSGTKALTDLPLTVEEYAFAVQKGDAKTKTMVNAAMEILKANGKFDKIVKKYFGE